jgi:hypothetical protein
MKALLLLSLVALAPLAPPATQTAPKSAQTAPKTKLGARLVPRNNAAAPLATAAGSQYTQIDFNWDYTPNVPACGTSLTNCVSGFTLTDTTMGAVVAAPSVLGPSSLSYAYMPSGGVPYGTLVFSLVANGFDGLGNPLSSSPATVSVVVNVTSLNGPTNLTGKLQ